MPILGDLIRRRRARISFDRLFIQLSYHKQCNYHNFCHSSGCTCKSFYAGICPPSLPNIHLALFSSVCLGCTLREKIVHRVLICALCQSGVLSGDDHKLRLTALGLRARGNEIIATHLSCFCLHFCVNPSLWHHKHAMLVIFLHHNQGGKINDN